MTSSDIVPDLLRFVIPMALLLLCLGLSVRGWLRPKNGEGSQK